MTKSELITDLARDHPHLTQRDIETIVATVFQEITEALARGDRVELRGFGAFTVKLRDARTGRNPRTGAAVPVDEKAVPFFKAGKELRERVNRGRAAPARDAPGRDTPGRNTPGRNTPGRDTPGRNTPGRNTLGRGASSPRRAPA